MKEILTALLLMTALIAGPAMASCDNIHVSGISEEAVQKLRLECQQALLTAAESAVPELPSVGEAITDPEQLSQWGVVAKEWAGALGIAARELGIAVDEFLGTTAGKLTAAVIIYQIAGDTILGLAIGIPLLIMIITIALKMGARARIVRTDYHETEKNWRGKPRIVRQDLMDVDKCGGWWAAHIVGLILSIFTVALIIFP